MVNIDGNPSLVGNNVANTLQYKRPHAAVMAHCKRAVTYRILTNGGEQEMIYLLYSSWW